MNFFKVSKECLYKNLFPIFYALAWMVGFLVSIFSSEIQIEIQKFSNIQSSVFTLFITVVCIFGIFAIEAILNFLELSVKYSNLNFSPKILSVMAFLASVIILIAFSIILFTISEKMIFLFVLMLIVSIFKFYVIWLDRNIEKYSSIIYSVESRTFTSNI